MGQITKLFKKAFESESVANMGLPLKQKNGWQQVLSEAELYAQVSDLSFTRGN